MKTWKIEIELKVADCWVEDGFNPDAETIEEVIKNNLLTYATSNEFKVKATIKQKPSNKEIKTLQGY